MRTGMNLAAGDGEDLSDQLPWLLRLYVAGRSPKCVAGQYDIGVVDLLENPRLAKDEQIIAIPTLVRKLPEPLRKIIGDLSNSERMLVGLDLKSRV